MQNQQFDLIINYARVSTLEQSQDFQALEQQLARLDAAIPKAHATFYDELSGDRTDRPGYLQCLEMAKTAVAEGKNVMVRVTDLTRWGRNDHEIDRSVEEFDKLGITLYALSGGKYSGKTSSDWLRLKNEGIFAQYYLRQLSERICQGNEYRRKQGKPLCNTPPFGYRFNEKCTQLEPNPDQWQEARSLIEAYLNGAGLREVTAMSTHFRHHTSVRQWILNPTLAGDLYYTVGGRKGKEPGSATRDRPKQLVYNCHTPLISREEQRLIVQKIEENKLRWGNNRKFQTPVLSGLVRCAYCGYRMSMQRVTRENGSIYRFARCRHPGCCKSALQSGVIEEAIQEAIALRAEELAAAILEPTPNEKPPELLELERQRDEVMKLREQTGLTSLDASIEELDRKIAGFEKPPEIEIEDLSEMIETIADTASWESLKDAERRSLYLCLVKRVVVRDKEIESVELAF